MLLANFNSIVTQASFNYGVEPELIFAIIQWESGFNPTLKTYEKNVNDYSVGLMQIRTETAKILGLTFNSMDDAIEKLKKPEINIPLGTKYLRDIKLRYTDIKDIIAAYNAGSVKKNEKGEYINQRYVNEVYKNYLNFKTQKLMNKTLPMIGLALLGTFLIEEIVNRIGDRQDGH